MSEMIKFEGRVQQIEVYQDVLNSLGSSGDTQITSSAILSAATGSVSLGAQSVFMASQSRLHIQSVVMEVDGKICVGKFHRVLLEKNEYVICIARQIEQNVYELYSVLSPKTGLLHMQVGMGASIKTYRDTIRKGMKWAFILLLAITFIVFVIIGNDYSLQTLLVLGAVSFIIYFVLLFIGKRQIESELHNCENSEKVFSLYKFSEPEDIYLLRARHEDQKAKLILESVYDYRKVSVNDPYPESYLEDK